MSENLENRRTHIAVYVILFSLQIAGAITFIWIELPEFQQVAVSPGNQLPYAANDELIKFVTVLIMQLAYWYRVLRVPIPFQDPNIILHHVFLFFGRLSFIFGAAIFSTVFFRHLPELERSVDVLLLLKRGAILSWAMFALFCATLELERLGNAFGVADQS